MLFSRANKEQKTDNSNTTSAPTDIDGFDEFMQNIKVFCGVDLSPKREITLQRLTNFAKNNNIKTFKEIANTIRFNSTTRQDLLNLITVNETYFYRELPQLKDVIMHTRDLANARILCAPCSTGDEVYSLAMLAYEYGIDTSLLSIVGIDINSEAIAQANSGSYNDRNLHRLESYQKDRFFNKSDDKYTIKKSMLSRCEFKVINIFDDAIFNLGKFDIILSRNMMIYFDDAFRLKCIERLHKMLQANGRLYTGHADLVPHTDLYSKHFSNGTSYYKKE